MTAPLVNAAVLCLDAGMCRLRGRWDATSITADVDDAERPPSYIPPISHVTLPPTSIEALAAIDEAERFILGLEQVEVPTQHLIHAGMYARTIVMAPGVVLTGALMKLATLVIVAGSAAVFAGGEWVELDGYNVIPASAGRKQVFVARSEVRVTMVFPTHAKTVEAAEAEFTDDAARLMSRRQDVNTVVITGE